MRAEQLHRMAADGASYAAIAEATGLGTKQRVQQIMSAAPRE